MDLLRELIEDYKDEPLPLMEAISQSVRELKLLKKGGTVTNKMVKDFMKSNKKLVVASALNSLAAYAQYKTNARNTITLFASNPYERKMITKMVQDLVKGKQFKIHRQRWKDGGKYWELKKIKSGY